MKLVYDVFIGFYPSFGKDTSMFNFNKNKPCKRETKTLQELNLIDSFLFGASTEKTQDAEFIAKLIIERATERKVGKVAVVSEKVLTGVDTQYHGIHIYLDSAL